MENAKSKVEQSATRDRRKVMNLYLFWEMTSAVLPFDEPLFEELSPFDKSEYFRILNFFAYADDKNKRNCGLSTFIHHLSIIHSFVVQRNHHDVIRGIVCGIEFTPWALLLNTGRLKKLMGRSKSCMNGCFQRLGYQVFRPARDMASIFAQIYPKYTSAPNFIGRQWCIRKLTYAAAICFIPNLNVNLLELEVMPVEKEIKEKKKVKKEAPKEVVPEPENVYDIRMLLNRKEKHAEDIEGMSKPVAQTVCC